MVVVGIRKVLTLLALLLGVLCWGSPVSADDGSDVSDRELVLDPAAVVLVSELAYPTVLRYPGFDPVVRDLISGRVVVPRSVEVSGSVTLLRVPQLPVGRFEVSGSAGVARFDVTPEYGEPVELTGVTYAGRSWWWLPLLAAPGLLFLRRRFLLVGVPAVVLLAGGLYIAAPGERLDADWSECDLLRDDNFRVQELSRRDCKVRYALGVLGPDGSGAPRVQTLLDTTVDQSCHEVVHQVGYYFSRMNADVAVSSRAMLLGCDDGMVHGVLEARGLFRSDEEFLRDVDEVCADSDDVRFRRTCAHGVGHAMFWRTGADLDQTWSLCDRIRDERSDDLEILFNRFILADTRYSSRAECKSASVMEWADRWGFERINGVPTVLSPVLEEPMDVCRRYELEEMFQVGCYLGTNYRSDDPVKAALRCEEGAPYPVSCFAALGDNLGRFALNDLDGVDDAGYLRLALSVGDACMLAGGDDAAFACARHLAFRYFVSVQKEQAASRFCAQLPGGFR